MSEPRLQYAALPYRRGDDDDFEILLVTSLGTKRWIIPKGWPMNGRAPHEAAAREALEEAGVVGEVGSDAIGSYLYEKRRKSGAAVPCQVEVYPLEVTRERERWPEQDRRQRRWLSAVDAAATVSDGGLGDLILDFARRVGAPESA